LIALPAAAEQALRPEPPVVPMFESALPAPAVGIDVQQAADLLSLPGSGMLSSFSRPSARPPASPTSPHGGPVKISAPMVAGGNVQVVVVAGGGTRILYAADQDVDTVAEYYSVPVGGGPVIQLNPPLVAGGSMSVVGATPDGNTAVYIADQDVNDVFELYSVPVTGGAATKLNGTLVLNGDVQSFAVSADSTRVVYLADQDADTVNELYSVPVGGGAATKLNGALVLNGDVLTFAITRDSARAVYRADQVTDAVDELFSTPIGGGASTKLNPTPVLNGDVTTFLAGAGSRVFYFADQDTDAVLELYSVPDSGGAATKLNGPMVAGGNITNAFIGNTRVAYLADQDVNDVFEVYSVAPTGGGATKLNPALVANGDVAQISIPDVAEQTVFYRADQDTDEVFELYSVPATGGASTKLNPTLALNGDVTNYASTSAGSLPARALYFADQDTDAVVELYGVPVPSGAATKINGPLVAGGNLASVSFLASGALAYRADQDSDTVDELYIRTTAGVGPVTKANLVPVLGGDVIDQRFAGVFPVPTYIVYRADQDTDGVIELYSSFLDGDADGDGTVDGLDCLSYDATMWDLPGEVTGLLLAHTGGVGGTTTLSWSPPASPGGTAPLYDTIRSSTTLDFVTGGTCVETQDGSDTSSIDTFTPGPDELVGFLVRAANLCGAGPAGSVPARACP
jgi:hypothetical protein